METLYMKSRTLFLSLILMSLLSSLQAQETDLFQIWPDTILSKANSASQVSYMSDQEKNVVFYINMCRVNPPLFAETYFTDYIKERKIKKDKDVKGLIKFLENTKPRVILQPNELLTDLARNQAKDMGESGRTGHNSSDGTAYRTRIESAMKSFNGVNENANYGNEMGIDIVIDLLIDRDVPDAGHRKNILDPEMEFVGVAIEPHRRFKFNCVQDFGGSRLK
jgi:hypothetical protein